MKVVIVRTKMVGMGMAGMEHSYSYDCWVPVGEVNREEHSWFVVSGGREFVPFEQATMNEEHRKMVPGWGRYEKWPEHLVFEENYGFRPNGARVGDELGHGIYSKDLNGDYLDVLTEEMCEEWRIELEWEEWE